MDYFSKLEPSKCYHIYNHAVGKENFFRYKENFLFFLLKYKQYIEPIAKTFAYSLMPNHFHFSIQIRDEVELIEYFKKKNNIAELNGPIDFAKFCMQQFSNLFNSYSKSDNKRYNRKGALFVDYMRRIEINTDLYFTRLIHYIHYNAVHHGFCNHPNE